MVVDIEKIKEDIEALESMDVDAEVAKHLDNIREQVIASRDAEIAQRKAMLNMLADYEIVEEECEECEECEDAEADADEDVEEETVNAPVEE